MSGVLGKCLSNTPNIQLLEEEQAAKSIVVSNISPQTTKEGVTIHFQRQKNGGGEIDALHIPKEGTAVITFEKSEVVETVQEYSHTLEGSTLKLDRLIPNDALEVFQLVKARVNFDRFQLSCQEWGKALEVLKHKAEVQCPHISNKEFVLYGTFNQILTAQTILQDILHRRSSVLQQPIGGNDAIHQSDTTQTQQNSLAAWEINVTEDLNCFEVQPQFMKLIKRAYEKKLRYIEETYGLDIVWAENAAQVQMSPSKASTNPCSYQEGCDAFIDLYQSVCPNIGREEVEIENVESGVIQAINSVEAVNNVVIDMVENKIVVYAEKNEILGSLQALREKLGLQQGFNRRARRSHHRTTTPAALQHNETPQDNAHSLKQSLSNGVSFSLYQSDITDESVDAIVNAANERLQHAGGVAAAIVLKGGRQIEEESRQIMMHRNKRPLNVGDAVYTKGGNLSCRYVIHTVGPRWSDYNRQRSISLLQRACMESLYLAAELKLSSIALPAVSSGIFGMPKSLCAQVMFTAIEEFSSSTDSKVNTLRDVRIVIIDDQTISVFREEFVKRYTSQEGQPKHLPHSAHHPRAPNEEQKVSSALSATAKDRSFSLYRDSSEEQSKKSGEDNANVESPNEKADPNVEGDQPNEQMPDGLKKVHSSNPPDNPPNDNENKTVETDLHGKRKEKNLGSSPLASNKSDEDGCNVESSNEGVGPNVDNSEHREEIPAGIKEGSSNNNNSPNESKDNPPNSNEKSTAETEAHGSNMEKHVKGSSFVKNLKPSNMATAARPSSGRGRGILAANFYGRLQQEASGSESNENTELATTRKAKVTYMGKGRAITFATNTSPPGLSVTEEGKRFARDIGNGVKGDQRTDTAETVMGKEELEKKESSNEPFKVENQELEDNYQNTDNDRSIGVPGSRLPHKNGIIDMEETKKNTIEKLTTDDERKLPTNENANNLAAPNQLENMQETGVQAGHSSSDATCDGASYPKEPSPFKHPEMSPASENFTASHESVNVHNVVEERRATVLNTGSEELRKMQKTHSTGEPKCSMCMNLNKDPVYPVNCGHYFCKSCTKRFIEKTMNCPVCKKENNENQFRGNQPIGYMTWRTDSLNSLPGYQKIGTIVLTFNFDKGIQGSEHPNPGEPYCGLFCTSYLPNNPAGQEMCNLLRRAFNARLIFTIGNCPATGEKNKIVSNGIELKWNRSGGPANCGYPDPSYLDRVKSQLAKKGITQPLN